MAKELYDPTPWWSNLVAVLITAIVSVLATAYYFKGPRPAAMGPTPFAALAESTLAYLPHILLLFGVLADAFTYEGVYAIPSGIGLISVFLNFGMRYFWDLMGTVVRGIIGLFSNSAPPAAAAPAAAPAAPMRGGRSENLFYGNYNGCEIQGFAWARNPYAPQTLVFTATVFLYYIFDLVNNRGWMKSTASIALFAVLYLAQVFVIGDCPPPGDSVSGDDLNKWVKALIALIEGALFGGVSYSLIQSYVPERLPSSSMSIFPRMSASQLTPGKNGSMVDSAGNPYVCLPNGQCVPDLSTTESRKNFADLAGEMLGTGKAAVPSDCPASSSGSSSSSSS